MNFDPQDMTKAELYKRRSANKPRTSGAEPVVAAALVPAGRAATSLERDVELIRANTLDTPPSPASPHSRAPPAFDDDDIPPLKPVEKTYAKSRSKLDDYIYIESSQGLDETEVAFPKTTRGKKSKERQSPVPRKRRKVEKAKPDEERELRSKTAEKPEPTKRVLRNKSAADKEKKRPTKESIENEKTVVTRVTRKRKYEETSKPVLREKGQNGHSSRKNSLEVTNRKIAKAKKTKPTLPALKVDPEPNVRMTRSRRRRLEISLSPSQVKNIAFSFESDRRVDSSESNRSAKSNTKAKARNTKAQPASKAKKTPVRSVRTRATRR